MLNRPVQIAVRIRRTWRGAPLSPLEEVRMFFRGEGPICDSFERLRNRLVEHGLPHIFLGAAAVNAHGYRRSTEDVDVCMRREDLERFRRELVGDAYQPVQGRSRRFYDPESQVTLDVLVAGEIAGNSQKQQQVRFPDPSEAVLMEGAPVVSLPRLVELKLVTWRLKDWADVIELIRVNALDESFAEKLHPVARTPYRECYDQMKEEDKYNDLHEPREG